MEITVFCASTLGNDPELKAAAVRLGRWIGENGHALIYGGGDAGFMGVVAKEVFSAGGKVTGVLPGDIPFIRDRPQVYCTDVITAPNISVRKEIMIRDADAVIALPGALGTLDEITEMLDLVKLGKAVKPVVLYNVCDYYEPLRQMLRNIVDYGFSDGSEMSMFLFSSDTEEIGRFLEQGGRS